MEGRPAGAPRAGTTNWAMGRREHWQAPVRGSGQILDHGGDQATARMNHWRSRTLKERCAVYHKGRWICFEADLTGWRGRLRMMQVMFAE